MGRHRGSAAHERPGNASSRIQWIFRFRPGHPALLAL